MENYLRILSAAVKKDIVAKDYSKKNGLIDLLDKLLREDYPQCHKAIREILTMIDLKEGKIKEIPLDVNPKNKEFKDLEAVNTYLESVISLGLQKQVRKDQLEVVSEFLGAQ